MCQSNQRKENMHQENHSGIYPNLSEFYSENGNQQGQGQLPPIMQLLMALGLVPPQDSQFAPSAPEESNLNGGQNAQQQQQNQQQQQQQNQQQQQQQHSSQQQQGNQQQGQQPQYGAGRSSNNENQNERNCPNCHGIPQQQWRWEWPTCSTWSWPPRSSRPQPATLPECNIDVPAIFRNICFTVGTFFRYSTRISSLFFALLMVHILLPRQLLQHILFGVLATSLGLHLPTLMTGHFLWLLVNCLGLLEPLILAGLFVFAVHKMLVRREPLINENFWRTRFNDFRTAFENNQRHN